MKILWRQTIAHLLVCPLVGTNDREQADPFNCAWRDEGEEANPRYVLTILGALNGITILFGRVLVLETGTWRLTLAKKWW